MEMMKVNRRAVMSKRMIKTTLTELLISESLSSITVTKLCRIADINRSTFYAHYMDIFEVMEDMEDDFVQKISPLRMGSASGIMLNHIRSMVSYIDKHRETYVVLLKNGYLKEKCVQEWVSILVDHNLVEEEYQKQQILVKFMFGEISEILQSWVLGEIKIPYQELMVLLFQIIESINSVRKSIANPTKN